MEVVENNSFKDRKSNILNNEVHDWFMENCLLNLASRHSYNGQISQSKILFKFKNFQHFYHQWENF